MVPPYSLGPLGSALVAGVAAFTAAALTWWLTGRVRQWAIAKRILDIPNDRSLHSSATPRGGGLAIAIVVSSINAIAIGSGYVSFAVAMILWLGTASYAGLGAVDDQYSLSARLRFTVQVVVATMSVGGIFTAAGIPWNLLTLAIGVALTLALVWMVNLYNFMDGCDGIAAVQAVMAGFGGAYLAGSLGFHGVALGAATVAGASLGFLWWNWQPARIFLGDAGSYFLGAQFGLLIIATALHGVMPWFWLILLSPFIADSSLTLLRRLFTGRNWHAAHRTHAYQLLIRSGWSHRRVALSLAGLVAGIAYPGAWVAVHHPDTALMCVGLTYAMIATLWALIVRRSRALL